MKAIGIISLLILFSQCQHWEDDKDDTTTAKANCLLTDTAINKLPYGVSKYEFVKFSNDLNNRYLFVNENRLTSDYKALFCHDSLFSLIVELTDSSHMASIPGIPLNKGYIIENRFVPDFNYENELKYTTISSYVGNEIIDLYKNKYGTPNYESTQALIGDYVHSENEPSNKRHFRITRKCGWKCGSKSIEICFIEKASFIESVKQEAEEIFSNKKYIDGGYIDFIITYENLKMKGIYFKEVDEKNIIKQKEDSIKGNLKKEKQIKSI